MKYIFYLVLVFFSISSWAQSGFNYQGVLRTSEGDVMANVSIDLRFRLMQDTTLPDQFDFEELQNISTNKFGVFSTALGISDTEGIYSLDLSVPYFMEVALRAESQVSYEILSRSALAIVPYALHAVTAENTDDADADPTNEMQVLTFDTSNNLLQISGGNAIQLPTGNRDADSDPENELQKISKVGNRIRLSGGGEVIDEVQDDDADPGNEIQQLSREGNTIKLSNGGEVVDQVKDNDSNPENEIQKISLSGSKLKLSRNGGEINLTTNSPWLKNDNDFIYYDNFVGIGINKKDTRYSLQVDGQTKTDRLHVEEVFIMDYKLGGSGSFYITPNFGSKVKGGLTLGHPTIGNIITGRTSIWDGEELNLTNTGYLQIGKPNFNIAMDENEIMARASGKSSPLYLQHQGGDLVISETSNGKVGIHTKPTHEFHVKHGGSSTGSAGIKIENSGSNKNWWSLYTANGSGQFEFYHKGVIKGKILPTDGSYVKSSDIRLKHDIKNVESILEKVLNLAPKTYLFNDHPHSSSRSIGFIAQEVKELFPDLVQHNPGDKNKFLSLNYDGFSVLAIKAIQEQQISIEVQQTELQTVRNKLENLEAQFQILTNLLKSMNNEHN